MSMERRHDAPLVDLPEIDPAVDAAGGGTAAVRRDGDGEDGPFMAQQHTPPATSATAPTPPTSRPRGEDGHPERRRARPAGGQRLYSIRLPARYEKKNRRIYI